MGSRGSRTLRDSQERGIPLRLDLNALPSTESKDQGGTSGRDLDQEGTSAQSWPEARDSVQPALIDVDAVDDDVLISSPSAFAEAKRKATRGRSRTLESDADPVQTRGACNNHSKRRKVPPAKQTVINCDLYINLEGSNSVGQDEVASRARTKSPPPPNNPGFSCPICMGQLVEEMTTKCGHIFCKTCIKTAIAAQTKCPTCRKRTTMKDIIRVYLPART